MRGACTICLATSGNGAKMYGMATTKGHQMMVQYGQTMLQRAAAASSGAVAGLTSPAAAGVPTASGGPRASATATRVSGSCLPRGSTRTSVRFLELRGVRLTGRGAGWRSQAATARSAARSVGGCRGVSPLPPSGGARWSSRLIVLGWRAGKGSGVVFGELRFHRERPRPKTTPDPLAADTINRELQRGTHGSNQWLTSN
jgi:hypothetical protein